MFFRNKQIEDLKNRVTSLRRNLNSLEDRLADTAGRIGRLETIVEKKELSHAKHKIGDLVRFYLHDIVLIGYHDSREGVITQIRYNIAEHRIEYDIMQKVSGDTFKNVPEHRIQPEL